MEKYAHDMPDGAMLTNDIDLAVKRIADMEAEVIKRYPEDWSKRSKARVFGVLLRPLFEELPKLHKEIEALNNNVVPNAMFEGAAEGAGAALASVLCQTIMKSAHPMMWETIARNLSTALADSFFVQMHMSFLMEAGLPVSEDTLRR